MAQSFPSTRAGHQHNEPIFDSLYNRHPSGGNFIFLFKKGASPAPARCTNVARLGLWALTRNSFVLDVKMKMMKKEKSVVRNKWVTVRLNDAEHQRLEQNRRRTTEKTNSNYLRKLALQEPVTRYVRNQSIDELTAAVIGVKNEINFIGHNFNQVVHKLHTIDRIAEFRNWALQYDLTREHIQVKLVSLLLHIDQMLSQWSQK